jgi:predicted nucleic acid-binding protein
MTTAPVAILVDTNIFVAAEQHTDDENHPYGREAAELLRLAAGLGFRVCLSHATARDVASAPGDLGKRRRRALAKYDVLRPAHVPESVRRAFGDVRRSQHRNDLQVVATFAAGVAQFLVSNDAQLRSRARRAGLENVLSLDEALAYLRTLQRPTLVLPPAAERIEPHQVNVDAPLFDTLKADYDFVTWWRTKVVPERRDVLVVGDPAEPDAVAVLKVEEAPGVDGLDTPLLKVCTFKVSESAHGVRRGELLLKAVVEFAREHCLRQMYMEVFPKREELVEWLPRFGFSLVGSKQSGELILAKRLEPPPGVDLAPLDHAVAYGPGSIRVERAHLVPIQDRWHRRLLPEASEQGDLLAGSEACGNAILKAYVSRAPTRRLCPGDCLLFLRTGAGVAHVTAAGVVEKTTVTDEVAVLLAAVGTRTVYSAEELASYCRAGPTLAVLFRMDRRVTPPWYMEELEQHAGVRRTPQSISELSPEGAAWVRGRLAATR